MAEWERKHCIRCGKAEGARDGRPGAIDGVVAFRSPRATRCYACDVLARGEKSAYYRIYSRATYAAEQRLKDQFADEWTAMFDEELARLKAEEGWVDAEGY